MSYTIKDENGRTAEVENEKDASKLLRKWKRERIKAENAARVAGANAHTRAQASAFYLLDRAADVVEDKTSGPYWSVHKPLEDAEADNRYILQKDAGPYVRLETEHGRAEALIWNLRVEEILENGAGYVVGVRLGPSRCDSELTPYWAGVGVCDRIPGMVKIPDRFTAMIDEAVQKIEQRRDERRARATAAD